MAEHLNFKIPVWPHAIEYAEEDLCAARLLLHHLQKRCDDLNFKFYECEPEEKLELQEKLINFLEEMSNIFHFVGDSLETRESALHKLRSEGLDEVISARGSSEKAA